MIDDLLNGMGAQNVAELEGLREELASVRKEKDEQEKNLTQLVAAANAARSKALAQVSSIKAEAEANRAENESLRNEVNALKADAMEVFGDDFIYLFISII